ncbi:ThuA domain-containing protein [Candidatus Solirubrobacter pratensis]|uniref:ThuA domain-containing protein n=1 Tax=Candidatus Solirubrobacter pratensis TaxID=1298857 RepID=UPI0003FF89B3|nr:ThuA domain-containing protein [Candidatus Solirubrobacter pratensis]
MRRQGPRVLAMAAVAGTALAAGAPAALAQGPDTTPPVLNAATLPALAPPSWLAPGQTGPVANGNNGWYTTTAGTPAHPSVMITLSATDDVAVAKFQYSTNNGASYTDVPVATPGPSATAQVEDVTEGATTFRYRAVDTSGNVSQDGAAATVNGGLNQPAAAGATAIRLASTSGRAAGDRLTIDTGANQETAIIASIVTPAPASPNPNVTLTAPLAKAHAAAATVTANPPYRTVAVSLDTRAPSATLPASVVNFHVGHSVTLNPTRTDPTPGSGQTAALDTWTDGVWTYPLPLDVSKLSLGKHTWALHVGDNAGLGTKITWTLMVTTSFTDIDALLGRSGLAAGDVTTLRAALSAAKASDTAGDKVAAIDGLQAFIGQVNALVPAGDARNLLVTDAQDVIRQERGLPGPDETGIGAVSEPMAGAPRHNQQVPTAPSHNANATFKVLVFANNPGDYRHESIEDAAVLIQQLGKQYGFDVDIWDKARPDISTPDTPFSSAANLTQYKVLIGDSSVGNNTLVTAFTMKNGTVVNEQAAFQAYMEAGGGYMALHAADDSLHNWQWYKDAMGGLFQGHPTNAGGFGSNCSTCYWAELITEDGSHPATQGLPARFPVADELYHFDRKPRPFVHPLLLLNEATYATAMGVNSSGNLEGGDHPIVWCRNFDGGRWFVNVLGHNHTLFTSTPWFQKMVIDGLLWAAGKTEGNCVTYTDVKTQISQLQTAGGLTSTAAGAASAAVDAGYAKYATLTQTGYSGALGDIASIQAIADDPASGDAAARLKLRTSAQQLKDWMLVLLGSKSATVGAGGTVPATLALSLGGTPSFGTFLPGIDKPYDASTTANVISTGGDAALSVADPSSVATGHLVNGSFSLPQSVQAKALSPLGAGGDFAPVGGASAPTRLLTYSAPASNDTVALTFRQAIGATDALRTGTYSKTLTFTLSTTTP